MEDERSCTQGARRVVFPSNPDDASSDTYLALIIQATFTMKERTKENALWAQSVLEAIFDKDYLDSKIDAEVVEKWNKSLHMVVFEYI